jgi:hypothetical protein
MEARQEKIKLLNDIRDGLVRVTDLINLRVFFLDEGKISEFAERESRELSLDQFCKTFRAGKDLLFPIPGGCPRGGENIDLSGSVMAKIIEQIPELDTTENREFIDYCNNLRKVWIEKLGWEKFSDYQTGN